LVGFRYLRNKAQLVGGFALLALTVYAAEAAEEDFAGQVSAREVALELVLALDSSTSVSDREFLLQRRGLAAAFRDPEVCGAIEHAGPGGVAVAVTQWSNAGDQVLAVRWTRLLGEETCEAFADRLDHMERRLVGGTVMSGAIDFARRQILRNAYAGKRAVIDLSGDGPDRHGVKPALARDRAVQAGITINALAIMTGQYHLDRYLRANIIGGPGAFVMTASGYEDFASAMRQKLIREIARPSLVNRLIDHRRPDSECSPIHARSGGLVCPERGCVTKE
jgi:hypothetical protein